MSRSAPHFSVFADATEAKPDEPALSPDRNGVAARQAETSSNDGDGREDASPTELAAVPGPAEPAPSPAPADADAGAASKDDAEAGDEKPKRTGLAAFPRRGWWQRRAD